MKKINNKVLVIPPYISTDWSHVQALFVRDDILHVALQNGERISIPNLSREEIENIFSSHSVYLETAEDSISEKEPIMPPPLAPQGQGGQNPFRISFGAMDNLGNIMQHNPELSNAPQLPTEIAEKIASIAKIIAPEELSALPKAEPHCNCVHCQIVRAMNPEKQTEKNTEIHEEAVSDADLQFCQWDIVSESDKIFTVVNRIDQVEKYKVCLDPMGCTCGREGCEHIVAVLKS